MEKEDKVEEQETSAETQKTETPVQKEETMIPKFRLDEVLSRAKEAESKLKEIEEQKKFDEEKKLAETNQFKELWEKEKAEKDRLSKEVLKNSLIQSAVTYNKLNQMLAKLVTGETEEEIQTSIDEVVKIQKSLEESFAKGATANDKGVVTGKQEPKTHEDYIRIAQEDPDAFRALFRK